MRIRSLFHHILNRGDKTCIAKIFGEVRHLPWSLSPACSWRRAARRQPHRTPPHRQMMFAAPSGPVVNSAGVQLPDNAAPLERQVLRQPAHESPWMTWDASVYDVNVGDQFAWSDSCVRPDKQYEPQPDLCTGWEVSEDGLTWTFTLDEDRVWSDGTPITAGDMVFTLQRYARPDYDFEWFYSMMGIENWGAVVGGEVDAAELGVKAVDDYTFTITTERPVPFLIKIMADVWVVPQHVVQDRLKDGTWALNEENWVFAGPYKLVEYNKGQNMRFEPNERYTGPFLPQLEEIEVIFMEPETRFNAFKNDELDTIGGGYEQDLPPSAMAEIMADPAMTEQLNLLAQFHHLLPLFRHLQPTI